MATIKTDFEIENTITIWAGFEFLKLKNILEKLDMYKTMTLFDLTFENLKDNHTNSVYDLIYKNLQTEEMHKMIFIFEEEWKIKVFKLPIKYMEENDYIKYFSEKENIEFSVQSPNLITGINTILKEFGINLKIHKIPFIYSNMTTKEMINELERVKTELILNKR